MTIADTLMILAVIAGPILAVQAQKAIEAWKQGRDRKTWVFKTLMATRGTTVSPRHVEALNMIDLEFSEKNQKERPVVEAWKIYLDHLYDAPQDFQDPQYQTNLDSWTRRSQDCLVDLLHAMGHALGYDFDKVRLKKGVYTPKGHTDYELENSLIRRGTLDLLYGTRPLPIRVTQDTHQNR